MKSADYEAVSTLRFAYSFYWSSLNCCFEALLCLCCCFDWAWPGFLVDDCLFDTVLMRVFEELPTPVLVLGMESISPSAVLECSLKISLKSNCYVRDY